MAEPVAPSDVGTEILRALLDDHFLDNDVQVHLLIFIMTDHWSEALAGPHLKAFDNGDLALMERLGDVLQKVEFRETCSSECGRAQRVT